MLDLKHGADVLTDGVKGTPADVKAALDTAKALGNVVLKDAKSAGAPAKSDGTPFEYLFPKLKNKPGAHLPGDPQDVVNALDALGNAMTDPSTLLESNSTIPAVYVYWGQFIDHDVTINTNSLGDTKTTDITQIVENGGPASPDEVTTSLRNLRRPTLDLDSVYGDGPAFLNPKKNDAGFYDGPRLRVGTNHVDGIPKPPGPGETPELGEKIPPVADLKRDLPRIGPLLKAGVIKLEDLPETLRNDPNRDTRALIGDSRNDENLIVAQFHLAFLRFHNKVVDRLSAPGGKGLLDDLLDLLGDLLGGLLGGATNVNNARLFEAARRLTRWHYQWLVVNDFLKTITWTGTVEKILADGPKFYKPLANGRLYMPLEFSVAAYRFGHSMVRSGYDHNRNFGIGPNPDGRASFEQLFELTGGGFKPHPTDPTKSISNPLGGSPTLPFNWIIEWDRFTDKNDPFAPHFGKKIDTKLAAVTPTTQTAVLNMINEGNDPTLQTDPNPIRLLLRHLARRNLLRGYMLSIPTGQAVAKEMGITPLTQAELLKGNTAEVNKALEKGGFLENTPLWYYILKEAEVRADGNTLGRMGSRIVAETIIGVLLHDKQSYLNAPGGPWKPSRGVKLDDGRPIVSIRDFLAFTGVPA